MNTIKKYIMMLLLPLLLAGCNNYFDINTDPNNPSAMSVSKLLPYAQISVAYSVAPGARGSAYSGIGDLLNVYIHQVTIREEADKYGATGGNWTIGTSWRNSYTDALVNLEDIIRQGTENGDSQYAGIAKVLKVYLYSVLVDVYAQVPYSEAIDNFYPHFDEGDQIYQSLFALLDEAIANLNDTTAPNELTPGADDLIYGGDMKKWTKAAYTLKLKLLNQVRLVQNVGTDVQSVLSQDLISTFSESLMFKFNSTRTPDNRNPAYGDTYEATQKTKYMSPWFYEILMGYNPNIFSGNKDPRLPYYFYNQVKPTEAVSNRVEYRDGGFISIYFGSDGPDRDNSQDRAMTVFGIYPAGGLYDDGGGTKVNGNSSTGAAPFRMITYADRLFIEAELIQAGIISGDVQSRLRSAIEASFTQVDEVVTLVGNTQTVPKVATATATTTYIDNVMAEFNAADNNKKMEIIITQKWISEFGNGFEAYNDYRRTGYPILFDPNNPQMAPGGYATPKSDNGGDPGRDTGVSPAVKVSCSRGYPMSLPWPNDELEPNTNAPAQKSNLPEYKVFWNK
ncbi:MAG: SusD/RagB family nutrient-binding outer membrane lipoprotein [Candidatus Azobacteroides sp.]|nr:SusD/RagB family nutrient-binding outer membrane lipoprotein [Candidatus Azobacteroides sp.]